jgi:hypothetical protein
MLASSLIAGMARSYKWSIFVGRTLTRHVGLKHVLSLSKWPDLRLMENLG